MADKAPGEFDIINKYFGGARLDRHDKNSCDDVLVGVGDDAAAVNLSANRLVVATDTLNSGAHFPDTAGPTDIARRVLAVNLSDFAAMAAMPRWATLSLTMPGVDEAWIGCFSNALFEGLDSVGVKLVGGDTTKGPLAISMTLMGEPIASKLWLRSAAESGDDVWLSGYTGLGGAGLDVVLERDEHFSVLPDDEQRAFLKACFYSPVARLALSEKLHPYVNAAIDISDGLLADASHIAEQSGCDIQLQKPLLPVHSVLKRLYSKDRYERYMLSAGDDYELLFTANPSDGDAISNVATSLNIPLSKVGEVLDCAGEAPVVRLLDEQGKETFSEVSGFQHF